MKSSDIVKYRVGRLQRGHVFTYSDLDMDVAKKDAVIKALNRMVEAGTLKKLSKGKYYKSVITPFGELQPDQNQIVKDILEDNGYLTGLSIFNLLGLTTQVGNTIEIGKNDLRQVHKRGHYKIKYIRQKNTITKHNIPFLQILDSIKLIRKIPDTNLVNASNRFISILRRLNDAEIMSILRLAEKYPASTRALLGFYLDEAGKGKFTPGLRKSLNPISKYKNLEIASAFQKAKNWNIV
ncbi:MAG TPA: hypothetical protein ENI20_03255 [Bacteroides sp.]|nr:hypothetical protein [Bacteroides sp.]